MRLMRAMRAVRIAVMGPLPSPNEAHSSPITNSFASIVSSGMSLLKATVYLYKIHLLPELVFSTRFKPTVEHAFDWWMVGTPRVVYGPQRGLASCRSNRSGLRPSAHRTPALFCSDLSQPPG